ncbi:MAG: ABC transporter permease [Actinobacteria bacterium]|nr:ABC transporter permease [Actinomycetota bacterium]
MNAGSRLGSAVGPVGRVGAAVRAWSEGAKLAWIGAGLMVAVAAIVAGDALSPRGVPAGIVAVGLVVGALNALVALGLVLIFRAGKYVNFAQGGIGAAGAVVAGKLITLYDVNYFLAAFAGLAVSVVLAGLAEMLFIRRLFTAPRLILTVATIGLAQVFGAFEAGINLLWVRKGAPSIPRIEVPFDIEFKIGEVFFGGEHLVVLVVFPVILAALIGFFRFTDFGAAVQASAENADRARLLGISVRRVSTAVWMIAGLLAGLTAVLQAPIVSFTFGGAAGPALLLRALAPAMIAGMSSLGVTVVAALALGVVEQAIVFNVDASGPVEMVLFAVILVALLVKRRRRSRTTEGEESSFAEASKIRPFPRELARIPSVRRVRLGGKALLLAVALAAPPLFGIAQQNLASLLLIYTIAAVSLTVLSGYAGQISFGHWAFVGFGALFGGWLLTVQGMNTLLAGATVCAVGTLLSLAIGLPALRIRGLFLAVTTLAFAVAAQNFLFLQPGFVFSDIVSRPVVGPLDFSNELTFYYLCLVLLLATLALVRNVRDSRWGRNFVAVRDNDRAAASYGVGVIASKMLAFAVSGFLASLAGFLYLMNQTSLNAQAFPVETSLLLFSAVVIGGLGSVPGAVIGALYLRGIQFFAPPLQLLSTSFGLLLILMFAPGGLGGLAFQGRDALLRYLAKRWNIVVPSLLADVREEPDDDVVAHASGVEVGTQDPGQREGARV